MANIAFNISKGKLQWYAEQARDTAGANLTVVLLVAAGLQADATLADHDNLSVLLAATNDECTFTLYARKTISGASVVVTVDDTNNRVLLDIPDQTWVDAGGAVNNSVAKALVVYSPPSATDTTRIPLIAYDFVQTTNGNDLGIRFNVDGFARVL